MTIPLLQTKLFIPRSRPTDIVARPRLYKLLQKALYQNLTLVSAPAGFGKTTLIASWLANILPSQSIVCAWLSLDKNDNDLVRFLSYFVAAIHKAEPAVGADVLSLLQMPQPPSSDLILTTIINDIATQLARTDEIPTEHHVSAPLDTGTQKIIIVLDDYHLINESEIHRSIAFWLEHAPPNVHLIMTTRSDPSLPLSLLRGRGQMTEIRAEELRFTSEESTHFLYNVMDLQISPDNVEALAFRTEGWIAGLKMAGISMRGQEDIASFIANFTGSHRYIIDYLAEQVLAQCSLEIQHFLLNTAFLERFCAPLCDAVLGQKEGHTDAQSLLEKLEASNLFIVPLDDERGWYRYHHLFAEFLRKKFNEEEPEKLSMLLDRASQWFEEKDLLDDAVDSTAKARNHERLIELIERHGEAITSQGELATMLRWFAIVPTEIAHSRPHVCLFQSIALLYSGRIGEAEALIDTIDSNYQAPQLPDLIAGRLACMQAVMHTLRQELEESMRSCVEALEKLPLTDLNGRSTTLLHQGNIYSIWDENDAAIAALEEAIVLGRKQPKSTIHMVASGLLANLFVNQGRLHDAEMLCRTVIEYAIDQYGDQPVPLSAVAYIILGRVLYEWNKLEEAERYVADGIRLLELTQNVGLCSTGYMVLARVKLALHGIDAAFAALQEAEARIRTSELNYLLEEISLAQCWLRWRNGESAEAYRLLKNVDRTQVHHIDIPLMEIRLRMAQHPFDAQALLSSLASFWANKVRKYTPRILAESRLIAAQVHAKNNEPQKAAQLLHEVVERTLDEGYIRLFVDEGEEMGALLQKNSAVFVGDAQRYESIVTAICLSFHLPSSSQIPSSSQKLVESTGNASLIEPLSERELEVLALLADGCSNAQIAEQLIITVGTTKRHVSNIYGKLGVNSRTQAVAYAREAEIL